MQMLVLDEEYGDWVSIYTKSGNKVFEGRPEELSIFFGLDDEVIPERVDIENLI